MIAFNVFYVLTKGTGGYSSIHMIEIQLRAGMFSGTSGMSECRLTAYDGADVSGAYPYRWSLMSVRQKCRWRVKTGQRARVSFIDKGFGPDCVVLSGPKPLFF